MTAVFMRLRHPLDAEILDDRVGEELAAHRLDVAVAGAVGQVELDQLAGADILDAVETQAFERVVDRFSLRVEHPGLEGDEDAGFHVARSYDGGDLRASFTSFQLHLARRCSATPAPVNPLPPYAQLLRLRVDDSEDELRLVMPFHEDVVGRPGYLTAARSPGCSNSPLSPRLAARSAIPRWR